MSISQSNDVCLTSQQKKLVEIWEKHTRYEFEQKNVDQTMTTMIDNDAYINNVPTMMGGVGTEHVRHFYSKYFIYSLPEDTESILLSRTVGNNQLVDETILKFTHTKAMDWILPGVAPTGKRVEIALVVIVCFQNDKVSHEHVYWDQASVLVQLGFIDKSKLPVVGIEGAQKVADPKSHPSNMLLLANN